MIDRAAALVVTLLATVGLAFLASPLAAMAQAERERIPRIGLIRPGVPPDPSVEAFRQGLRDLGYVEGRTIAIEYRWAQGKHGRAPDLAEELVRLGVDVIVTVHTSAVASRVPKTIPIVSPTLDERLVASLARPGGHITGLTLMARELSAKRLELLKETLPKISSVAVLRDPTTSWSAETTEAVARAQGLDLQIFDVRSLNDVERALAAARQVQAGALNIIESSFFAANRGDLVEAIRKARLPTIYPGREFVRAGGLMSYGPHVPDLYRRAATYVDKILKGARPADLPVEQPMKFEFAVNLNTAKALGVTIPQSVLLRADEVIQ
jgi:putative ABC transport system substrate-binding protein